MEISISGVLPQISVDQGVSEGCYGGAPTIGHVCMRSIDRLAKVPLYALLLFGGKVSTNRVAGGITIGSKDNWIKLKAWSRIGVLVNQLR